uniref:CX domain-containing protein n=1 Tax=Heterorhabditis bacteriophora TaxID=37862 RepID=A0A1I7X964_HETBA
MEIALQEESKGILYEGYTKAFRQCIFEEGDVHGKNERYEFRYVYSSEIFVLACNYDLECCGRKCCIPQEATLPLWLMIIFIILALLLLLAILGTLAWLFARRRKQKPKKAYAHGDSSTTKGGYTSLNTNGQSNEPPNKSMHEQDMYSTPDHLYGGYGNRTYSNGSNKGGYGVRRGYGNTMYNNGTEGNGARDIAIRDTRREFNRGYDNRDRDYIPRDSRVTVSSDESLLRHGVHETIEESFKQEITYERPASTDSRDML